MSTGDREEAIEAIVASARQHRPRTSRAMWIAAIVIGLICVAGFVVLMLVDGSSSAPAQPSPPRDQGGGFASGLAIGIGIGIAIGFAIARQRAVHSSRKTP